MGFVNNAKAPWNLTQFHAISDDHFKRCDEYVELVNILHLISFIVLEEEFVFLEHVATGVGTMVNNHVQISPRFEFTLPIRDCRKGGNDKERATDSHFVNSLDESQRLDRLAQTHFISQNAITSIEPGERKPIQSFKLILSQCVAIEVNWRIIQFLPVRRFRLLASLEGISFLWWWNAIHFLVEFNFVRIDILFQFPSSVLVRKRLPLDQIIARHFVCGPLRVFCFVQNTVHFNVIGIEKIFFKKFKHVGSLRTFLVESFKLLSDTLVAS